MCAGALKALCLPSTGVFKLACMCLGWLWLPVGCGWCQEVAFLCIASEVLVESISALFASTGMVSGECGLLGCALSCRLLIGADWSWRLEHTSFSGAASAAVMMPKCAGETSDRSTRAVLKLLLASGSCDMVLLVGSVNSSHLLCWQPCGCSIFSGSSLTLAASAGWCCSFLCLLEGSTRSLVCTA